MALICIKGMENINKICDRNNVCILEVNFTNTKGWYFHDSKKYFVTYKLRKLEKDLGNNELYQGEK